jgi:hypothetical protein
MEEIEDTQTINANITNTAHDWILKVSAILQEHSSQTLQIWFLWGKTYFKNKPKLNNKLTEVKKMKKLWYNVRQKPIKEKIEKGDLDPGE